MYYVVRPNLPKPGIGVLNLPRIPPARARFGRVRARFSLNLPEPAHQPASARRRRVDEVAIVALCGALARAIRVVSAAPEVDPSTRYAC